MRALLSTTVGGPETLQLTELPSPQAGAGEVVISVAACGVNFPDVLMIEDRYQVKPPRPFAPGSEIAGTVKAVGKGVTSLVVGDRVLSRIGHGGMTEELAIAADRVAKIPAEMPFEEAAALMTTYGTSYHALAHRGRLQAGETLLILGAAGGVGIAAVELGKAMGARVVAATSTQEKLDFCLKHGADSGIVYGRGPFDRDAQRQLSQLFKDGAGAKGANVIYDAVGDAYAEPALRSIAWGGRYLVVGFAAGEIPKIPLNLPLLKSCDICGVFFGSFMAQMPEIYDATVAALLELYREGKIKPKVSERFALAQGGDAIRKLASREAMGKLVVTMD